MVGVGSTLERGNSARPGGWPLWVGVRQPVGGNTMLFRYLTGTSWLRLRVEGVSLIEFADPRKGAARAWATTCLIHSPSVSIEVRRGGTSLLPSPH